MTLQNDIAQSLANELKNHIDKEIMDGFMTDIILHSQVLLHPKSIGMVKQQNGFISMPRVIISY
jgi:hypothetical protein